SRFPFDLDLVREQVATSEDREALRFAAAARDSSSRQAFRPRFTPADWRAFATFCVARRVPADTRLQSRGPGDRTLRLVVEGSLPQDLAATRAGDGRPNLLLPGTIVGEDALFSDGPAEVEVRTLDDALVLELSHARRKELTAAFPALAFELLRAAGAVIAA